MDNLPVDFRDELIELIQIGFVCAPIEPVRPVVGELLQIVRRYPVIPSRSGSRHLKR
ncbi:Uncharacterised protein [Mycobacteroides abscessus subsp. abscessus]|nr:Uncharacterised protein [Mycobacteroides abscessus subsp. abscessus]